MISFRLTLSVLLIPSYTRCNVRIYCVCQTQASSPHNSVNLRLTAVNWTPPIPFVTLTTYDAWYVKKGKINNKHQKINESIQCTVCSRRTLLSEIML